MIPTTPTTYTICILLLVGAAQMPLQGMPAGRSAGTVENDSCLPQITGRHINLYCIEKLEDAQLPRPQAEGVCAPLVGLSFREIYDELGCGRRGMEGYFAPSRWMVTTINGDGGVDVTGAPNASLVEGANGALVSVAPGGTTDMNILVPADGIVAFDWRNVGGSNLFSNDFQVLVNETPKAMREQEPLRGRFRSPVRQGDRLTLRFEADEPLQLEIGDFQLLTNASGVWQRVWTATDEQGRSSSFTQFISIEQPSISDVLFPDDRSELSIRSDDSRRALAPEVTGFPFIDRDGNPQTTTDRFELRGTTCAFSVVYSDEVQQQDDHCLVLRHWIVADPCGDNTLQATQVIKLSPAAGDCPTENLLNTPLPGKQPSTSLQLSAQPDAAGANGKDTRSF